MSHHHHRCLSSFFYFSHSESNFCGSHKCTDVLPKRIKRRLSMQCISQTAHVHRQPLSTHRHVNWVEEAFLLASSKWRACCAAAPCHRLGPQLAEMLQSAAAAVPGCGATQHSPPSLPPSGRASRRGGRAARKQKTSFQLFSAGLRDGSHFPSYILPSSFYFRYPA